MAELVVGASRIAAKNVSNPLSEEDRALSPDERCSTRPVNRRRARSEAALK
jgi:hypothetical protein